MNDKIHDCHLQRRAVVYLRQSTLKQVFEHPESTDRQYALRQRAHQLGWSVDRVDVIDDDLGQSGTSTEHRRGFQRLAEEVARGRVGAIFALEVSRLARSSADWYRLLDLCGLADVLLADEQAIYAPQDYNDRLLLGLKGTMSEAEQYWMRLRLQGGKLNKARRGDLYRLPPAGYQWDAPAARYRFDSDERVCRAIALVFERFRIDGSAYAVMRYLAQHGLKLPVRDLSSREVRWVGPRHSALLQILHNPTYAGAYVFGRYQERTALVDGKIQRRRVVRLAREDWTVCLRDHHPAYIAWEEYMANQNQLDANCTHRTSHDRRGAAREGDALLQGLALCGRCGQRMGVRYHGDSPRPHYECRSPSRHGGSMAMCWSVSGRRIDEAIATLFLQATQPPELELALAVARQVERQAVDIERQWRLRLERAHYDVRLAERRYKAVDPDNRVVARTLEREWNDKLAELEAIEREHEEVTRRERVVLTDADRKHILALAKNLPRVWYAPTTTTAERKNLLRMVIREVTLTPIDIPQRATRIQVLWQTGAVTEVMAARRDRRTALTTPPEALALIAERVRECVAPNAIADELNRRGLQTGHGHSWSLTAVNWVKFVHGLRSPNAVPPAVRLPDRRGDGLYSIHGVAARLGVTDHIVRYWMQHGWLSATEGGAGRAFWFRLDQATLKLLRAVKARGYGPKAERHPKGRH